MALGDPEHADTSADHVKVIDAARGGAYVLHGISFVLFLAGVWACSESERSDQSATDTGTNCQADYICAHRCPFYRDAHNPSAHGHAGANYPVSLCCSDFHQDAAARGTAGPYLQTHRAPHRASQCTADHGCSYCCSHSALPHKPPDIAALYDC